MLSYPPWIGDPSQLLPSPSLTKLPARVTATPVRASYHRISAWSPFERAHNTSVLALLYAVILLFFPVIKSFSEYKHLRIRPV